MYLNSYKFNDFAQKMVSPLFSKSRYFGKQVILNKIVNTSDFIIGHDKSLKFRIFY